jgi:hypothetical protein
MAAAPPTARRSRWLLTRADWVAIRILLVVAVVLFAVPAGVLLFVDAREGIGSLLWEEERMTSLVHETATEFKDVLIPEDEVSGIPPAAEAVGGGFVYIGVRPELQAEAGAICEEFRAAMLRNDPTVMPGFQVIVEGPEDIPAVITAKNDYQDYSPTYATCGAAWWAWWLGN